MKDEGAPFDDQNSGQAPRAPRAFAAQRRAGYLPLNTGFRFSRKAVVPSS